jgi:hypothetical protein
MITGNSAIAEWFDGVAEGLDVFLAGNQITNKRNNSKIRLENTTTSSEGQKVVNDFGVGVVLRLPNVEEYWQLRFTSYDEANEKRSAQRSYLRNTPREENYGASIGVFRKLGDLRVAFQPRVELQAPLKISHSLTFESIAEMKNYSINPKFEFYAEADKGTGVYVALNFNFNLSKKYSLTLINNADYISQLHLETVTHGFTIGQVITDKMAISYGFITISNNRPVYHLETYSAFVTWSQVLYKNILSYDLTPHLDFNAPDSFRGRAGVALSFFLDF